ncbi:3663_t:CDS:10 [Entrophospora sp. SA101]|nr:15610_t:CDS:10 [Entrophospora sp. SA101]CAJ0867343.1 3663_t:CDS:10 [Entrophospora sp. SA101]CAJ0914083.1 14563_t:CDS:10 [Entrophospora sp. SA101]
MSESEEDTVLLRSIATKAQQSITDNDKDDLDMEVLTRSHKKVYEDNDSHDSESIGAAAAFEALKKYHKGDKTKKDKKDLHSQFVASAMSESLKIWKKKKAKGEDVGKKDEVVEHAAKMAIKMVHKSEKSESSSSSVSEEHTEESHSKLSNNNAEQKNSQSSNDEPNSVSSIQQDVKEINQDELDENTKRKKSLVALATANHHVGVHLKCIRPTEDIFNPEDPKIREDIIRMIIQYLSDEGYSASKMTIYDEANVKRHEREEHAADFKRIKKAILDGDWAEVEKLCAKPLVKNHKGILYAVYKQQYLEYIEHQETQKAFTFLNKRLKPLEYLQTRPNEFKDLCYLLTAKAVHDAPSFKNWEGIGPEREKLAEQFQIMLNYEKTGKSGSVHVPPNRLLTLLRQAVAYQIEFSRYHPRVAPCVNTLLQDYSSFVIPNAIRATLSGHLGNVKCVEFIGEEGREIVSGSSDNTLRIWDTESSKFIRSLEGHESRIWDVSSNKNGSIVSSASGDGTVRLWDMKTNNYTCTSTLAENSGDVYTVKFHPGENHIVTGGYDKIIRFFDVNTGQLIKMFTGHQLSVSKTVFNPLGNLIISGSKDNTIKFWDIVSGLCIRTISSHLGEVTSVEMNANGTLLLSSSKDNSNRLWDTRPIKRLKGHQNTSKNFIRSGFVNNSLIVGGSEKLKGHTGMVYNAIWNPKQSLFVSCSDDRTLKTWWYDENLPLDL